MLKTRCFERSYLKYKEKYILRQFHEQFHFIKYFPFSKFEKGLEYSFRLHKISKIAQKHFQTFSTN